MTEVTADKLIAWMTAMDIKGASLARTLGVSDKTVYRWLTSKVGCPPYLGFALNWLREHPERLGGH